VLLRNESLRFICRDVTLVVERDNLPFTAKCEQGQRIVIPVKHGDGRWFAPPQLVRELEANRQVVLRYAGPCNGSVDDIAGICNERGNVMGLMPHPEHAVDPLLGSADGALILSSLVEAARDSVLSIL
jgi:phosphoribosylformylglycinamidine synthase